MEPQGVAAITLRNFGVDEAAVLEALVAVRPRDRPGQSGHIPFTINAKKALELSLREALQIGHNYIGTEHLLLGLTGQDGTTAVKILDSLGIPRTAVHQEVIRVLKDLSQPPASDQPPLPGGRPVHSAERKPSIKLRVGPRRASTVDQAESLEAIQAFEPAVQVITVAAHDGWMAPDIELLVTNLLQQLRLLRERALFGPTNPLSLELVIKELVEVLNGSIQDGPFEVAPVSWTPDYAGDRVGRSPSWVVRTSTPISSARMRSSW